MALHITGRSKLNLQRDIKMEKSLWEGIISKEVAENYQLASISEKPHKFNRENRHTLNLWGLKRKTRGLYA